MQMLHVVQVFIAQVLLLRHVLVLAYHALKVLFQNQGLYFVQTAHCVLRELWVGAMQHLTLCVQPINTIVVQSFMKQGNVVVQITEFAQHATYHATLDIMKILAALLLQTEIVHCVSLASAVMASTGAPAFQVHW